MAITEINLDQDPQPSPILNLPENEEHQQLLRQKQQLWKDRLSDDRYKWQPPEVRNRTHAGYAIRLVDELFDKKQIDVYEFYYKLQEEQGNAFNKNTYLSAATSLWAYVENKQILEETIARERTALKLDKN